MSDALRNLPRPPFPLHTAGDSPEHRLRSWGQAGSLFDLATLGHRDSLDGHRSRHDGVIVAETEVQSFPHDIDAFLSNNFARKDLRKVGLECGQLTIWLHKELSRLGYKMVMMESHDVAQKTRSIGAKTDKRDARAIADFLRANLYKEVHVKTTQNQKYRTLLNLRERTVNARVKAMNAIRGCIKDYGYKMGACAAGKCRERVYEILESETDPLLMESLLPALALLEAAIEQEAMYTKMVLNIVKENKTMLLLTSIPGVGPITAFAFVATVDNPLRFSKSRKVGAYFGLVPKTRQSGELDTKGGITKEGDKLVRSLLVEAAASMLYSCKKWNTVNSWGARICKKRKTTRIAVIAMARKLATIMHRMMLDETEFIPTKGELEAAVAA